jgi:heterodisulfide reductase subunit C
MSDHPAPRSVDSLDRDAFDPAAFFQNQCVSCGLCSSSCPLSGLHGFDPRKIVRMASFGQKDALVESEWPWMCTMCDRCAHGCPAQVRISDIVRNIRGMREKDAIPGVLGKGLEAALKTGNNLSLPKQDFEFILEDVGEEIAEENGFESLSIPIDKQNANLLTTIHNKLVNTHTEDLKPWWKIFHAAGEDWTVPSVNWEGTNWGLFTGDDESMEIMAGRVADNMERLGAKNLLWPE